MRCDIIFQSAQDCSISSFLVTTCTSLYKARIKSCTWYTIFTLIHIREVVQPRGECVCRIWWASAWVGLLSLLLRNSQLEEVRGMLALCTSSKWLLPSNQDERQILALAHYNISNTHSPGLHNPLWHNLSIVFLFVAARVRLLFVNMRNISRYRPEIPEPAPSLSRHGHGAPIGGYSGFSRDQNNRDSSGAYVLRSEREDKHAERPQAREDRGRILFAFVSCVCGRQKPEYPQLELHGWRRHYMGR